MNIWLITYQEEVDSNSHEYHMLLRGQDFTLAGWVKTVATGTSRLLSGLLLAV